MFPHPKNATGFRLCPPNTKRSRSGDECATAAFATPLATTRPSVDQGRTAAFATPLATTRPSVDQGRAAFATPLATTRPSVDQGRTAAFATTRPSVDQGRTAALTAAVAEKRTIAAAKRRETAAANSTAHATANGSDLGTTLISLHQAKSPDDYENCSLADIYSLVEVSPARVSSFPLSYSQITKTLPANQRNLRLAVADEAAKRKALRVAKKIEMEAEKARRKDASAKAARRASLPKPEGKSNNKGALFPISVISMIERRFLLDAVDTLKANGVHKSDESAGQAVHARLVAKDPLFARRFRNGDSKWYTRSRLCNWRQHQKASNARDLAVQNARRETPHGNALDILITTFLVELARRKLLFSIATACNYIDNNIRFRGAVVLMGVPEFRVGRAYCRRLMREAGLAVTSFLVEHLPEADMLSARKKVAIELAFIADEMGDLDDAVLYNVDETSLRLFPDHSRSWCFENDFRCAGFRATKAYTTVLCGISANGDILRAQVNWKGLTDGSLAFKGDQSKEPKLWQFVCQARGDSHWTTTESLMKYIREVIVPHYEANRKSPRSKFVLTLDHAPAHKSFETRTAFYNEFANKGYLVFIPKRTTNALQPLDLGIFGELKPYIRAAQDQQVISGVAEHSMTSWGAAKVKAMVMESVAAGIEKMRKTYASETKRNDLIKRCWYPLFGYKDRAAMAEVAKMKAMTRDELNEFCEAKYLFEFGLPSLQPLDKARPKVKGVPDDDEFFFETNAHDVPDLPESETLVRKEDEDKYYEYISEDERDE